LAPEKTGMQSSNRDGKKDAIFGADMPRSNIPETISKKKTLGQIKKKTTTRMIGKGRGQKGDM